MKQKWTEQLKKEIDKSLIRVEDFNTLLSTTGTIITQKTIKDVKDLKNRINQQVLIDMHRTLSPKTAGYTFFSRAYGTFIKKDHILVHKTSLNKCKRIEIMQHMFSDHNGIKREISNGKKTSKYVNTWIQNNTLLNKGKLKIILSRIENDNMTYKNLWQAANAVFRKTFLTLRAYIRK